MSKPSVAVVIPTYNGVDRLRFMLKTIKQNDPSAFDSAQFLVVEDPCGYDGVSQAYDELWVEYSEIELHHLDEWSNMHGAAKKAFEYAFWAYENPDWVIYLGDDLAVTPGALSNMIYFLQENPLETVSLVQFPYWNAHDLCRTEDGEWSPYLEEMGYKKPFWVKENFYANTDWVPKVPRNPHWDGEGVARSYVNVNGCGFAARSEHYRSVGGFADGTWCLDESISVRTWLNSGQSIVCLPGPPLVHYFGGSTAAQPKLHDRHTHEAWVEAMGMTKEEAGALSYKAMHEREDAVKEEMARCKYFGK